MLKWRPLTQEELPDLLGGDIVQLRQNYLYKPERLSVIYVEAQCIENESGTARFFSMDRIPQFSISLTEVGRYMETGWQLTGEELSKLKLGDPVLIHEDSGEYRRARYMGGESPYSAKIIYERETVETSVILRLIAPAI